MSRLEPTCHLAEDLMIAYAAGEVSEVTSKWMKRHIAECPSCARVWLDFEGDQHLAIGPNRPGEDPGRKLLRRIRRDVGTLLVVAVASIVALVLVLGWAGGGQRTVGHEQIVPQQTEPGGESR